MNWGWKIFLVFVIFIIFIMMMVFKAIRQDFHLVADNYYEKEIKYQGEIEKIKNARALEHPIVIEYQPIRQAVILTFPKDQTDALEGNIYFFRPSDSNLDQNFIINPDSKGMQLISVKSLKKGLWQVKVSWQYGSAEFQEEKNLILQE